MHRRLDKGELSDDDLAGLDARTTVARWNSWADRGALHDYFDVRLHIMPGSPPGEQFFKDMVDHAVETAIDNFISDLLPGWNDDHGAGAVAGALAFGGQIKKEMEALLADLGRGFDKKSRHAAIDNIVGDKKRAADEEHGKQVTKALEEQKECLAKCCKRSG